MPTFTNASVGVSANASSQGQGWDFDSPVVTGCTLTNNSGISIQYSEDGSTWVTVADGATANPNVFDGARFRIRKTTSDSTTVSVSMTWTASPGDAAVASATSAQVAALKAAGNPLPPGTQVIDPSSGSVLGVVDGGGNLQSQAMVADIAPALQLFTALGNYTKTAADTVNADVAQVGSGSSGSIRFISTATASKNAYIDADRTFNLNLTGGFWVCWRQNFKQAAVQNGLTAYMSHSVALGSGVGRVVKANFTNLCGYGLQTDWFGNADWGTLDGTPNFANDWLSLRMRLDSSSVEPHDFELLSLRRPGPRAKIIVSFDDGWTTSYTVGHDSAQKRGIPLTHYLIGSLLNSVNYITTAQALTMQAAGDYLGLHGANPWNSTPTTTIAADISGLAGIAVATHASWPEGNEGVGTNPATVEAAASALGIRTCRQISSGSGNTVFLHGRTNPLSMPAIPLNNSTSLVSAKASVDRAIASGGALIFYAHKLGGAADSLTWVTSDFNSLLDYIAQKQADNLLDTETINSYWSWARGLPAT